MASPVFTGTDQALVQIRLLIEIFARAPECLFLFGFDSFAAFGNFAPPLLDLCRRGVDFFQFLQLACASADWPCTTN